MGNSGKDIKVPTYTTDKRQLVQITELIIDGEKLVKQTPLKAYQTIHRTSDQGNA